MLADHRLARHASSRSARKSSSLRTESATARLIRTYAVWTLASMAVVASIASPTLASFGAPGGALSRVLTRSDALSPPPSAICIAWPVLAHDSEPLRIDLVADSSGLGTRLVVNGLRQATVVTVRGASVAFDPSSRPTLIDRPLDVVLGRGLGLAVRRARRLDDHCRGGAAGRVRGRRGLGTTAGAGRALLLPLISRGRELY